MAKDKTTERAKPFLILAAFIIVWWVIPAGLKTVTKSGFREFQAPAWELASRAQDLTEYWGKVSDSKRTLIEKGREAARTAAALEAKPHQAEVKRLQAEIRRLEEVISLQSAVKYRSFTARVSRRELSGWWQTINLREGSSRGLKEGMGVIFTGGVAGKTVEVGSRWATVSLASSPRFRIAAHFEGDDRPVTYQGGGIPMGGKPFGIVRNVPHDLSPTPEAPLRLLTSSLGETFPDGIIIGKVMQLEGGEDGLFKSGKVWLDERLGRIREVTALMPEKNHASR